MTVKGEGFSSLAAKNSCDACKRSGRLSAVTPHTAHNAQQLATFGAEWSLNGAFASDCL